MKSRFLPILLFAAVLVSACSDGYVTTESGLKYRDDVVGMGDDATAGMLVSVHYTGWLQNADSTEFTISLRDGVEWSDGEAFNADDVMFTVNLALSKIYPPMSYAHNLKPIFSDGTS